MTFVNIDDPVRRWTRELAQLRARAVRAGLDRNSPQPLALSETLREALAMCVTLVQELDALKLDSERLSQQVEHSKAEWDYLFDAIPVPCLCTDAEGVILYANQPAALLLNVSTKRLVTRMLSHFVDDRSRFATALRTLPGAKPQSTELTVRPRERAPRAVKAVVLPRSRFDLAELLWFLIPADHGVIRPTFPTPADDLHAASK